MPPTPQDGNYLDRQTHALSAELLTFSAELRVFGYVRLAFSWMADGSVALSPRFLGLPALTYLRADEAVGSPAGWNRVAGNEFAGLWVLTLVFVAVVIAQAVRTAKLASSRDLTLRQVRATGLRTRVLHAALRQGSRNVTRGHSRAGWVRWVRPRPPAHAERRPGF